MGIDVVGMGRRVTPVFVALLLLAALAPAQIALAARSARFVAPPPAVVVASSDAEVSRDFRASLVTFTVRVGPTASTPCDVASELFMPLSASARRPVPVILTTNGFGGSYKDQLAFARYFAGRGYAVLTYSGLGFGDSGCNIMLDAPEWDGLAASQLISYLGSRADIAKDGSGDPRVGMIGGSYGGDVQFSTASIDPRLDTLVPMITWNDLAYSLGPNNTSVDLRWDRVGPGVPKLGWTSLFFALGLSQPLQHLKTTPMPPSACPGFDPRICRSYATSAGLGYLDQSTIDLLRHTSMTTFHSTVRLPVMLIQGQADSLFGISEAVANYNLLRANGSPVKLVLQSWGHSNLTPKPGEVSYESTAKGYETLLIQAWFARYLKHETVSTGPAVEYFRDWIPYDANGSAASAYGTGGSWPLGAPTSLYLSGDGRLVTDGSMVRPGTPSFANPIVPASYSEVPAEQGSLPDVPSTDLVGSSIAFDGTPLAAPIDVVGVPSVRLRLSASTPPGSDPTTHALFFAKLYDVGTNGRATLIQRLVSPVRVADMSRPVVVTLPGIVHRFGAGHRVRLVLSATDDGYAGSRLPNVLTVTVDPASPTALSLPVVGPSEQSSGGRRATGA